MISFHEQASRGAFPMNITNHFFIIRYHKMLSRNQNQRYKGIKVKIGIRTWLALAVAVWMIYQLRVFFNHKQSSENLLSVKEEIQSEKLKLGRKGLLNKEDEENGGQKLEIQMEEEQGEDLVDGKEKSGDDDEEEIDTVRFDDPMDEIDSLNDDGEVYDDDDDGSTDHVGEEEVDSPLERLNADRVGT